MNKETVQDYSDEEVQTVNQLMPPTNDNDRMVHLKRKINNLLWEELPAETSMADAEIIACRIFQMINKID